jgi:hypothetical protein
LKVGQELHLVHSITKGGNIHAIQNDVYPGRSKKYFQSAGLDREFATRITRVSGSNNSPSKQDNVEFLIKLSSLPIYFLLKIIIGIQNSLVK